MKLTCVCGYSVDDGQRKIENVVYYQSGRRKGEVKRVDEIWEDIDKDKPRFIEIKIERNFQLEIHENCWYSPEVSLYACPQCHTIKMVK